MFELIDSVKPTCRECGSSSDARLKHFLYSQETGGAFRCATGASPGINTNQATVMNLGRWNYGHVIRFVAMSDLSRGPKSEAAALASQANHLKMVADRLFKAAFPRASKIKLFVVNSKGN